MKRCPTAIVGAAGEDGAEPLSCLYSNGRAKLLLLVVGLRRSIGNGLSGTNLETFRDLLKM